MTKKQFEAQRKKEREEEALLEQARQRVEQQSRSYAGFEAFLGGENDHLHTTPGPPPGVTRTAATRQRAPTSAGAGAANAKSQDPLKQLMGALSDDNSRDMMLNCMTENYRKELGLPQSASTGEIVKGMMEKMMKGKNPDEPIFSGLKGQHQCARCGTPVAKVRCGKCKINWYCDEECQKADWEAGHKHTCEKAERVDENKLLPLITEIAGADRPNNFEIDRLARRIRSGEFGDLIKTAQRTYRPEGEEKPLKMWAPIHEASRCWSVPILCALLEAGANPNARDGDGETAVFNASTNGFTEGLKALAMAKADITIKAGDGWSPLMQACSRGYIDTVKTLLQYKAPLTGPCDMMGRDALALTRLTLSGTGIRINYHKDTDPTGEKHLANLKVIEKILVEAKKAGL